MTAARKPGTGYRYHVTGQQSAVEVGWLRRDEDPAVDDAGAVLLTWRTAVGRTQTEVAGVLGTTQQHLSQIETGQHPVSLERRCAAC